jgi:hypothetical protein
MIHWGHAANRPAARQNTNLSLFATKQFIQHYQADVHSRAPGERITYLKLRKRIKA